jgi:acetate kinase
MKILIANPGSTSYKCKLYDTNNMDILFQAAIQRIGDSQSDFSFSFEDGNKMNSVQVIPDYNSAVELTIHTLNQKISTDEIDAVGFKTVHAKDVSGCVELDSKVLSSMEAYRSLAPVHTDVYITAIKSFQDLKLSVPLVGLFETHFHVNIPEEAYLYGIPYELYQKYGIRKYGFHGASHRYIGQRAKELYDADKVISCHLGGSSSVSAIKYGWSVDTSMGMSPQSGLLNSNRVGDLDPFGLLYLMEKEKLTIDETRNILMNKGGIFGISGRSGDLRDIEDGMKKGNERDEAAFNTFAYYVKRYIGEYLAVLNGADCIVFTAGGGENSPLLRKKIISEMNNLGVLLDDEKNNSIEGEGLISKDESDVLIAVIPTNEEFVVSKEVEKFLSRKNES